VAGSVAGAKDVRCITEWRTLKGDALNRGGEIITGVFLFAEFLDVGEPLS
jgi:hypothetical protein